jgi:hypothetical protein
VSDSPENVHITLSCVRLSENTSVPDLLARFVKSENNLLNVVVNVNLTLCERVMARMIFDWEPTSAALAHLLGSPDE